MNLGSGFRRGQTVAEDIVFSRYFMQRVADAAHTDTLTALFVLEKCCFFCDGVAAAAAAAWPGVQPYVINGAKVLFLRSRPQPRAPKSSSICGRWVAAGAGADGT